MLCNSAGRSRWLLGLILATAGRLWACGFDFPNRVLFQDNALKTPQGYFTKELARIAPASDALPEAIVATFGSSYHEAPRYSEQTATGDIPTPSALRYASFQLPATQARELKVWTHRITTGGDSEGLPTLLKIRCSDIHKDFDLSLSQGQVLVPFNGQACHLTIAIPEDVQFSR